MTTPTEQFRSFSLFFVVRPKTVYSESNRRDNNNMTPKASFLCLSLFLSRFETAVSFTTVSRSGSTQFMSNERISLSTPSTWPLWAASDDLSGESSRKVSRGEDKKMDEVTGRFATGEELKRLRADLDSLRENLSWAEAMEDHDRIEDLAQAIKNGENRDPDVVYRRALRNVIDAKASFKISEEEKQLRVKKWQKEAAAARRQLPRFQMEGLWVGRSVTLLLLKRLVDV